MRSSLQTELEKVTRENADLKNSLIAKGMKLKVKEEELDQSKKEAEKYKNSTVQLAKKKSKLEEELIESKKGKSELEVGMGKKMDKLKSKLENVEEVNRDLERKYLLLKVYWCANVYVCMCCVQGMYSETSLTHTPYYPPNPQICPSFKERTLFNIHLIRHLPKFLMMK